MKLGNLRRRPNADQDEIKILEERYVMLEKQTLKKK